MLLEGKTAIVTGASGGIGKAVAIALAKEGAAVAVHFHGNEEKALLVKKEIEEAGGKAEIFRANVADFEECNALVKAVAKTFGSIDILVNNAGMLRTAALEEITDEDWDAMFEKDRVPFCFVTELGDWHESASMGWWAITTNEKDENDWINEFKDYLDTVSEDTFVTVIDFHI